MKMLEGMRTCLCFVMSGIYFVKFRIPIVRKLETLNLGIRKLAIVKWKFGQLKIENQNLETLYFGMLKL